MTKGCTAPLVPGDLDTDHGLRFAIGHAKPFPSAATRALRRLHPALPPPPVCVFLQPRLVQEDGEEGALEQARLAHRVAGDRALQALFALRGQGEGDEGVPERMLRTCERFRVGA